jgi:transposase
VVEYKDVYPDDPSFGKLKAHPLEKMKEDGTPDYQTCTRYVYVPGHFKKVIYRLHRFTQDGKVFEPKTPPAVFMNSNYTSSFVAPDFFSCAICMPCRWNGSSIILKTRAST